MNKIDYTPLLQKRTKVEIEYPNVDLSNLSNFIYSYKLPNYDVKKNKHSKLKLSFIKDENNVTSKAIYLIMLSSFYINIFELDGIGNAINSYKIEGRIKKIKNKKLSWRNDDVISFDVSIEVINIKVIKKD